MSAASDRPSHTRSYFGHRSLLAGRLDQGCFQSWVAATGGDSGQSMPTYSTVHQARFGAGKRTGCLVEPIPTTPSRKACSLRANRCRHRMRAVGCRNAWLPPLRGMSRAEPASWLPASCTLAERSTLDRCFGDESVLLGRFGARPIRASRRSPLGAQRRRSLGAAPMWMRPGRASGLVKRPCFGRSWEVLAALAWDSLPNHQLQQTGHAIESCRASAPCPREPAAELHRSPAEVSLNAR
jgi:hypothetical protein